MKQLATLLCLCMISVASASTKEKTTYTVGAQDIAYLPHYDFDNEVERGAIWRLLELYAADRQIEFEYVALPIKRLHKALLAGSIDFVFPDNPKWFNQQFKGVKKHYSNAFYEVLGASFVHTSDYNLRIDDVERLSVPSGFSPVFWQSRIDRGDIMLLETTDAVAALRLVVSKRAQVTDLEYSVVEWHKKNHPDFTDIRMSPFLPHDVVAFHLTTVHFPELLADLDAFLLENATLLKQLKQQYGIIDARKQARLIFKMQ
ncbi:hypothetical protein DRW07_08895 [Alteromonas sediminis]|uniref:Solute-binding protein family 3/N-terminal domain-containing protein n=1 Tax=Alteromonas sediminis TaxID=2259342 RepID=A0A3N5Y3Z0_9ALTE|nr:hypothetical protein [Alteromonas sediminis]RPJ67616.1 hypothetical protein DRW07_08895 [Alteromonas sediminis]